MQLLQSSGCPDSAPGGRSVGAPAGVGILEKLVDQRPLTALPVITGPPAPPPTTSTATKHSHIRVGVRTIDDSLKDPNLENGNRLSRRQQPSGT